MVDYVRHCVGVTPDDANDMDPPAVKLWVGVAGDIKLNPWNGGNVLFKNVPIGWFEMPCRRVWATGTTATNLLAITS